MLVISFYLGLKRIEAVMVVVRINAEIAMFLIEEREASMSARAFTRAIEEGAKQLDAHDDKDSRLMRAQFRLLIAGAVFFMVWRILQIF